MKIPQCNTVHAKEFGQCIEDIFLKQVGYAIHSLHICYWNLKQIGYAVHSLHISYPPPPSPETIWLHSYPTESHANRKINKWTYFPTNEHSCLPTLHRYVQFKTCSLFCIAVVILCDPFYWAATSANQKKEYICALVVYFFSLQKISIWRKRQSRISKL